MTETVKIVGPASGSPVWYEVADETHQSVNVYVDAVGNVHLRIQDSTPGVNDEGFVLPIASGGVRANVQYAATKVWLRLLAGSTAHVIRGSAIVALV